MDVGTTPTAQAPPSPSLGVLPLRNAALVFNADLDELLCKRGSRDLLKKLFASNASWCLFASQDVVNVGGLPPRLQRFADYWWTQGAPQWNRPKYLVVPSRCPDNARWWHHSI